MVRLGLGTVLFTIVLVAGCASIDFDYPRVESHTLADTADTRLAKSIATTTSNKAPDTAGFRPVISGIDALAARLLLAARAERSIDVQYYLIKDGAVGDLFVHALLQAADRGVRVRLLLDDMFTGGYDESLLALDSHENFHIRIYNPFHRGVMGRAASAATDFRRINRRLHNKSFTTDNQVTVIGGRNIADEYFAAADGNNFGDLDVIGVGPVVAEVSEQFDLYWNHRTALPIRAFMRGSDSDSHATLESLRDRLQQSVDARRDGAYAAALTQSIHGYLGSDDAGFEWAPYQLVYDHPDKGVVGMGEPSSIASSLVAALDQAEREVVVISPYFVPTKSGVDRIRVWRDRGIVVHVITNSLAANNQKLVHGGYMPSRRPLLEAGVHLYEVRADAEIADVISDDDHSATLHSKAFVVDRKDVFIGSFNFDPRSANLNTEMGVVISDPELGEALARALLERGPTTTYRLALDAHRDITWETQTAAGATIILKREPDSSWWERMLARIARILPIHSQL